MDQNQCNGKIPTAIK